MTQLGRLGRCAFVYTRIRIRVVGGLCESDLVRSVEENRKKSVDIDGEEDVWRELWPPIVRTSPTRIERWPIANSSLPLSLRQSNELNSL